VNNRVLLNNSVNSLQDKLAQWESDKLNNPQSYRTNRGVVFIKSTPQVFRKVVWSVSRDGTQVQRTETLRVPRKPATTFVDWYVKGKAPELSPSFVIDEVAEDRAYERLCHNG
jgi:hypothetical protein